MGGPRIASVLGRSFPSRGLGFVEPSYEELGGHVQARGGVRALSKWRWINETIVRRSSASSFDIAQ